jgi:ParB-like chromosome segregation protein Spo0J
MKKQQTEALKIEMLATEQLVPYARNAKLHSETQIAAIAKSIEEFGFNNPVLIDAKDGIIAGHGRVLAAKKLGMAELPCIRLGHLTEAQKRAYIIADNRLSEIGGGWDLELLKRELEELQTLNIELELTGFDLEQLNNELAETTKALPKIEETLRYSIVVECIDEQHQRELLQKFEEEGLQCRPLMF